MDSHLLKTFLVLAKTKNFTKTAQRLFRSQSAISLQIARLETALGRPLFARDRRNVVLTPEGERLIGYAQEILEREEEMMNYFRQPVLAGEVKFGTPEDLATLYLPNLLGGFMKAHPKVLLNVDCELTMHLLEGFEARRYDLVLIKQDPQKSHPLSEEVWKEPVVWVSAKASVHFDSNEKMIPLILAPSPCVYRRRAIDALNGEGIHWRIVYTSPSLTGVLAAVRAGLGISILPLNMVPKDFQIVRRLPPLNDAQIALLKHENSSEPAKAMASYIARHLLDPLQT